jgi:hypothetical protein
MTCFVCQSETERGNRYCPRHRKLIVNSAEQGAQARAFKKAYDKRTGNLIDYYLGIPLDESDPDGPLYPTCDHRTPGRKGNLVVTAAWVNRMKTQLSEHEFRKLVAALAAAFQGAAFDPRAHRFRYWLKPVILKMAPVPLEKVAGPSFCRVCETRCEPYVYCPQCRRLIFSHPTDHLLLAEVLRNARDKFTGRFMDHYLHIPLDPGDNKSPLFSVFDHRIPRKEGDLVLCAAFVNSMKGSFSDEEFRAAIIALARHFAGEPFDVSAVKFEYWSREATESN